MSTPSLERSAAAALAAFAAAAGAVVLPFYPPGLVVALALLAGALSLAAPRAALAVALAAPILPFGNLALGAALAYSAVAVFLLALGWRDARAGLLFAAGPLLGAAGVLALVPLAVQPARGWARRAVQAGVAVLATAIVCGLEGLPLPLGADPIDDLGLTAVESPGAVAQALAQSVADRPELLVGAVAVAAAAALLRPARARGLWGVAGLGAGLLAALLLGAPDAPALPLVAGVWLLCAALTARVPESWR